MKIKVKYLEQLMKMLISKTDESRDKKGLQRISDKIKGLSENYLYTKIELQIRKEKKSKAIGMNQTLLDRVAQFLEFDDIEEFIDSIENPLNPQLSKCIGEYYSYVRRNQDKGKLYRSPARMIEKDRKIYMELKGGRLNYSGEVSLRHDCLFVLLDTDDDKAYHHVYKIGKSQAPEVLQGIFSGISNAPDPIGGRAVLIRTEGDYKNLKNEEMDIDKLKKSKSLTDRRLAEYFQAYHDNNLAIKPTYSFDLHDLGNCE